MIALPFFRRKPFAIEVDPGIAEALRIEREKLRTNAAALQSGSRVLQNMAGAMQMMALVGKVDDSKN